MTAAAHRYSSVVLGYAEDAPASAFHPRPPTFASKAGGLPVWLYRSLSSAPPPPRCAVCGQPQRFLLQIYAPVERAVANHDAAFHRVLYVAICPAASCQTRPDSAAVLRAQLPRRNDYYPYEAADGQSEVANVHTCVLCGFGAANKCGACQNVSYCGRVCQLADWKLVHKGECAGQVEPEEAERKRAEWRFRELEIVTEEHPTPPSSDDEEETDDEDDEEDEGDEGDGRKTRGEGHGRADESAHRQGGNGLLIGDSQEGGEPDSGAAPGNTDCGRERQGDADSKDTIQNGGVNSPVSDKKAVVAVEDASIRGTFQDADADELPEEIFRGRPGSGSKDSSTARFQRVVSYASSQVVRYEWDGTPLWAARGGRCEERGQCERCGAERVFEMQVMAQLAWFVKHEEGDLSIEGVAKRLRDGMEWATVAVFSCRNSCQGEEEYVRERAWVQRFAEGS